MNDKTKITDATYGNDLSGLKLDKNKTYNASEVYFYEAQNILKASIDYLSTIPNKKSAPFDYDFFLKLHKEMFGDVWDWAGKMRIVELNFGVKAYLVNAEVKKLADDLHFWKSNKSFDTIEIAARLHHRAVAIHPFLNGNGRWSRMLANIYLKQNGLEPTKWNENLLAKKNIHRGDYIQALKQADNGNYKPLIKMQGNMINK
ncbi:MAG: mobile mystery protein B [Candidatus Thioglobus sp.]|uniref:mobile mystery protein B n=1 Tax=Candidatus Thioglobus sp. TaxID=2026721 RepID=UPI00262C2C40|nr:mobile mystery protein B [Candidatus Thioglobus sp.]MDC9727629.1 mobile mystery protein B [Candidatus Thioglobus sp.]